MSSTGRLDGKVALVTGAAGMIGLDTARLLAEHGASLVLADLAVDALRSAADQLAGEGHTVRWKPTDITDEDQVRDLVAFAVDELGRIDVVDNNAGATGFTGRDVGVIGTSSELWERSLAINATGPLLVCKHAIPVMVDGGGGSIVNITSSQSLLGDLQHTAYSAGKAALNSLTRDIAAQHGGQGIRCNAVAAGFIVDPAAPPRVPERFVQLLADHSCLPRVGTPRDISNMVAFLASDLSSFVTGQTICVDGGILIQLPTVAALRAHVADGPPPRSASGGGPSPSGKDQA